MSGVAVGINTTILTGTVDVGRAPAICIPVSHSAGVVSGRIKNEVLSISDMNCSQFLALFREYFDAGVYGAEVMRVVFLFFAIEIDRLRAGGLWVGGHA